MRMALKRERELDLGNDANTPRPAISDNLRKQLFRSGSKRVKTVHSAQEDDMSELVHFILAHEEAFQRFVRASLLSSLACS
jgi:hypothetical protein